EEGVLASSGVGTTCRDAEERVAIASDSQRSGFGAEEGVGISRGVCVSRHPPKERIEVPGAAGSVGCYYSSCTDPGDRVAVVVRTGAADCEDTIAGDVVMSGGIDRISR